MNMTAPFILDENGKRIELLGVREICGRCNGDGTHVHPDVDGHGLTDEDFDDDPDFRGDYFSGKYDVTCSECKGNKIVLGIDWSAMSTELRSRAEAYFENERHARMEEDAERRAGC